MGNTQAEIRRECKRIIYDWNKVIISFIPIYIAYAPITCFFYVHGVVGIVTLYTEIQSVLPAMKKSDSS
jgi:hypothetical protein